MPYQSFFSTTDKPTVSAANPKAKGYQSAFGGSTIAAPSQEELSERRTKKKQQAAVQPAPIHKEAPKKGLLSKAKDLVVDTAKGIRDTGYKSANTVAAGVGGAASAGVATVQMATGHQKAANETAARANRNIDNILNHGAGNKGGFLSATQSSSSGGGAKRYRDDFLKPVSKGVSEVAPLVVPAGATAKGASLVTKVARGAVDNAAVGAGSDVLAQAADKGKVDLRQTGQAAASGALIGGVIPAAGAGGKALAKTVRPKGQAALPESHPSYFNESTSAKAIPVDSLKTTKTLEEIGDSPLNAHKLMREAAGGTGTKRDPILVHAQSDGSYHVLDGNATTTVAKGQGWKTLPADIVTSKTAPQADHIKAAQELSRRALAEDKPFQKSMKGVADALGLKYNGGPPKSIGRSLTKIMDDYGGDYTRIKDTIRGTMEVPDHTNAGFQKVIDRIKAVYPDATIKNGYKDLDRGYADVKVTVTTPNGHKGEIILATPEMLTAKNKQGGHELYEIYRDSTKSESERQAAYDQMMTLYGNAHDAANKRLASSGDLSYSETKKSTASAGETSSPSPNRLPGKRAPETTTVSESGRTATSTSSSEIKNLGDESVIPTTIAKETDNVKHKPNETSESTSKAAEKPQPRTDISASAVKTKGSSAQDTTHTASSKELADIVAIHRKRFGDENVKLVTSPDSKDLGSYNYQEDMIKLVSGNKGLLDTYNHESIHKAIGQFLPDKDIKQLYKDILTIRGGKAKLSGHYAGGGYSKNWRVAAEEEIANRFIDYLKHGKVTISPNIASKIGYVTGTKTPLRSLEGVFYKLAHRINEVFGRKDAQARLQSFYKDVESGAYKGAPRRQTQHTLDKTPLGKLSDKVEDKIIDTLTPQKKPLEAATATVDKIPTPSTKVSHTAGNSRVYERLQAEHPETLTENVTYDRMKLKEDADKAVALISKDKNQAYRIAMGAENSADVTSTAVNIAMAEKALDEGNTSLYAQLTKTRSLQQTRRGQEIVAEKGSVSDNSTSRYVKEVLAARMEKLGKNYLGNINTKLGTSAKQRALETIDKEVAKAQRVTATKRMDLRTAQELIDKLAC